MVALPFSTCHSSVTNSAVLSKILLELSNITDPWLRSPCLRRPPPERGKQLAVAEGTRGREKRQAHPHAYVGMEEQGPERTSLRQLFRVPVLSNFKLQGKTSGLAATH